MVSPARGAEGSLQLLLALLLAGCAFGGFGLWGLMRHWSALTELQLKLDRCAGQAAQTLRDTQKAIETDNRRIEALRVAIAAASANPPLRSTLQVALLALARKQDLTLTRWKLAQLRWLASPGCGTRAVAIPLPTLQWVRAPTDLIGPRPLRWLGMENPEFHLRLVRRPRVAGACVRRQKEGMNGEAANGSWTATWEAIR